MKEKKSKASLGQFLIVFLCVLFIGWYFMPFLQDVAEARPRLPDRDPAVIAIPTAVTAPEPAQTAVASPPPAAPAAQPTALVGETIYDDAIITTAKVVQACMADAAAKAAAAQHPPDCSKIVLKLRDLQERREALTGVGR